MGGSASCILVTSPRIVTVPSLPSVAEVAAERDDAHTRNAGTNARYGASLNTNRSALSGSRSSLKNSLMPSASVCSRPYGPALFGPMRFCMPDDDLALEPHHEHRARRGRRRRRSTTLMMTIRNGVHQQSNRSMIGRAASRATSIRAVSIRTSLTAAAQSMSSLDVGAGLVERQPRRAAQHRSVGARRGSTVDAFGRSTTFTSCPSVAPTRVEVERVQVDGGARREVRQRRRHRRAHGPVVQLAAHHQAIVVAVAARCGRSNRRERPDRGRVSTPLGSASDAVGVARRARRRDAGDSAGTSPRCRR